MATSTPVAADRRRMWFDAARLRRAMAVLVSLVVLAVVGLFTQIAVFTQNRAETVAMSVADVLARGLEAQVVRATGIAVALIDKFAAEGDEARERLTIYRDIIPGAHAFAVAKPDGTVIGSESPAFARILPQAWDLPPGGLLVAAPPPADPSERGVLAVARRTETGVVAVLLDLNFFEAFYATLASRNSVFKLSSADGRTLAAYPRERDKIEFGEFSGESSGSRIVPAAPAGREEWMVTWRQVADMPLFVSVAFPRAAYLSTNQTTLMWLAGTAVILILLIAALAALAWVQFGRLGRLDAIRRREHSKIVESRRRMRAAIDAMPAIVNAKDLEGRYTLINAHQARVFGVSPSQALGRRLADFADPGFAAEVAERERRILATGRGEHNVEDSFVIDGMSRSYLASKVPILDPGGTVHGIVTVSVDVTELKAVERKATLAESQLRAALDSIPEGFAIFDTGDRLVVANRPYARMFAGDVALETLIGRGFEDLVRLSMAQGEPPEPGFDDAAWVAERVRRHREILDAPRLLRIGGGRWISTLERHVPGIGIVGVRTDVTQAIETEAALRQARDAAEAANNAKSRFLANMSHELRTPLNAIIGFSELIERQVFGPVGHPRYQGYASDIASSGRHLVALIGDVLDMSKIEAGAYELDESEFDAAEWLSGTLVLVRGQAQLRNVALEAAAERLADVRLFADPRALRQVVLNLLSNAIKFTPPGGRVRVAASLDATGVEIAVADTGIGIAAAELPFVAEPFRQAHGTSARFGGTGLGLAISKNLVELHRGRLDLESAPGKGTVARVWLARERVRAA